MVLALVLFLVLDQTSGPIHSISPRTIPSNIPNGKFRLIPIPSIISSLRPSLCLNVFVFKLYLMLLLHEILFLFIDFDIGVLCCDAILLFLLFGSNNLFL